MAIQTDLPEIAALKVAVEKHFGHKVVSRYDFIKLGSEIEGITGEHIGDNTLRRLWGSISGYSTAHKRTLDVLSQYAGYGSWDDFRKNLTKQSGRQSYVLEGRHSINADDLEPGDRLRIGWLPDRVCVIEFEGGRKFTAIECLNSTINSGDSFECTTFIRDYPLSVDNFVHEGKVFQRYVMGIENGLTLLEKL